MSDSPQLREFLVRNIDNIANDTEAFVNSMTCLTRINICRIG